MLDTTTFVGLDVHARSIKAVSLDVMTGEVRCATFGYDAGAVAEWVRSVDPKARCVYESGVTGFDLQKRLSGLGVDCVVGAVSKMIKPSADRRRKNDRNDAEFLARMLSVGNVVEVWVPDDECEAARDLTRALEDARDDLSRSKQRLSKFLLRHGLVFDERTPTGRRKGNWTRAHWSWIESIRFAEGADNDVLAYYVDAVRRAAEEKARLEGLVEAEARKPRWRRRVDSLRCLKGVDTATAADLVFEAGEFSRFRNARSFAAWVGLTPSEHSSGESDRRGAITKAGNWIGYTDVDSSGRGAGDGRAVYEGPQAPEAFHRRVQEADSRPLQRRQAQARDHGRVRPRQEHRGEVDQVDKRDRLAARRVQPHARAEPDPGARAREPQAPDGGRRLKTSGADIRSKVRAIAANEGRYPISAQCRLLGVARSTYYSMRSRADRPAAPDPAAPAVVAAHAASKGRYGSRKIKASLERSGVTVSRRRVCRIMRENGLVSAYGRKRFKVHPGAVNEADVPNVVARGFGGRAPRTHICSDLTYVRVGASWNYVCLLVDLYNREIVGHSAGPRKDARLVKSAFATLSFPISDIEVFHTDRGSEFDNAEIDLMLEAFGIERSLSAKGCPYDNAVDESTNRILKAELVHRETFGTTRELRAKLSDYVHWYNNFRIHSTLGYMSPVEFREAGLSLPESSK